MKTPRERALEIVTIVAVDDDIDDRTTYDVRVDGLKIDNFTHQSGADGSEAFAEKLRAVFVREIELSIDLTPKEQRLIPLASAALDAAFAWVRDCDRVATMSDREILERNHRVFGGTQNEADLLVAAVHAYERERSR